MLRVASMWVHEFLHLYQAVDQFVAPSTRMIEELADFGIPREKISYLPTPVPANEYQPNYAHRNYFLFVGRVSQEKGLGVLLRAFRSVASRGYHLRLVAGSDEDFEGALAADLAQPGVDLVGPMYGSELASQYAGACALVVPSLSHDNSPNVVVEAMASGKPVIGSRVGGIPDQIGDDCGLVVEPGDAVELAAAMTQMINDEAGRAAMGRAARGRAETVFGMESHLKGLLSVFARLGVR
jgi:glycosyltransferase involved in cell wall biosynthesis